MKKSVTETDVLNDDDIRALLDARAPAGSPADLDQIIISAANIEAAQTQQSVENTSSDRTGGDAAPAIHRRRFSSLSRLLAVACVALLAVTLMPLMQSSLQQSQEQFSPDLTLLGQSIDGLPIETDGVQSVAKVSKRESARQIASVAELSEQMAEESADRVTSEVTLSADESSEVSVEASTNLIVTVPLLVEPAVTIPRTETRRSPEKIRTSAPTADDSVIAKEQKSDDQVLSIAEIQQSFARYPYRRTKATWRRKIEQLKIEKRNAEMIVEERLFERIYPDGK